MAEGLFPKEYGIPELNILAILRFKKLPEKQVLMDVVTEKLVPNIRFHSIPSKEGKNWEWKKDASFSLVNHIKEAKIENDLALAEVLFTLNPVCSAARVSRL